MGTEREIIERMRAAAPPGQESLGPAAVRQLQDLTRQLITAKGGAGDEYARFQAITQRTLCLPGSLLTGWLRDATVLVTGGTGCIGSTLMTQLAQVPPRRLSPRREPPERRASCGRSACGRTGGRAGRPSEGRSS